MYLEQLKISIRSLIVLSALTGIVYPLLITGAAQKLFPRQANGSLILQGDKVVGSSLIGQPFDDPKYFWSRPSATGPAAYNASNSSGSNLGPTNPALIQEVQGRIDALKKADPENKDLIPVDLVTSSASGLDPHITPAAARYQVKRVARTRGLSEQAVTDLVSQFTEGRFLNLLGESGVNVLKLNLALDSLPSSSPRS
jgi:K+-transporting ATPase ATPase C chain